MFSLTKRRALTGVLAAAAAAALLAGCAGGTPAPAPTEDSGATDSGHAAGTWKVTITSVAADKSVMRPMQEWYMDQVEDRTNGAIEFHRTTANELCAQSDQFACIENGSAQLIVQVPNYQPTLFAPASLPELTFGTNNSAAINAAVGELLKTNADAIAFLDDKNLHHVATYGVGRLMIGANKSLDSVADLNGLTMRTAGTISAPNLAAAGVIPTQVTADEAYNSFSTGLVGSAAGAMDFIIAWKLGEVLSDWRDPGLGVYSEFAMFWAKDYYDAFPDDIKAILEEIADEMNAGAAIDVWQNGYTSNDGTAFMGTTEQCDMILNTPNVKSMSEWGQAEVEEFKALGALVDGQTFTNEELWIKNTTAAGLGNAAGVLADYQDLVKHFEGVFTDPALSVDPVTSCIERFNS